MGSGPDANDPYELADKPAKPVATRVPPPQPAPTLGYRGLARDGARGAASRTGAVTDEPVVNFHLPLLLLVGGIIVEVLNLWWGWTSLRVAMMAVGIGLILDTIITIVGVWIAARIRQVSLGDFWTIVLKVAAISIATDAAMTLSLPFMLILPFGGLLGLLILFVVYFALLGALFDLDESDTWYFLMVLIVLWLILYFGLGALEAALT